jgi:hypothetical protein
VPAAHQPHPDRPLIIDELDYALPPGRFSWLPSLAGVVVVLRALAFVLVCSLAHNTWAQANPCEAAEADYRTGLYWASQRGSNAPALEVAERHYHSALSKLSAQPASPCRDALKRKVLLQLRILYQQDGLPLLPWKGWNAGQHHLYLPGVSARAALWISNDPAPSIADSRMRQFTAEAALASSAQRLGGTNVPVAALEATRADIARAPTQVRTIYGATLREHALGRVTVATLSTHTNDGQITSYYVPNEFNDTQQTELTAIYDRVFPVDPIVDLRVVARFSRIASRGITEFLPNDEQRYNAYAIAPSLSRTVGPGRLTLAGAYLVADLPDLPIAPPGESKRKAWDRGLSLQYAGLATTTFNPYAWGSFTPYRTVTEGFAAYLGFSERKFSVGLAATNDDDVFGGVHWEGPKPLAFQIEATAFRTRHRAIRADDAEQRERTDPTRSFASMRLMALPKVRLLHVDRVDPQPLAVANAQLAEVTLVFPVSWEFALDSPSNFSPNDTADHGNDYANVRVGSEVWLRSLSFEPLGGGLMLNSGFDLVHYYEIAKTQHLAHASVQLGW